VHILKKIIEKGDGKDFSGQKGGPVYYELIDEM
jgi:hypothetical protein